LNRSENGTSVLAVATREIEIGAIRSLMEGLKNTAWKGKNTEHIEIRRNIWVGQTAVAVKKTPTIPRHEFSEIYQACLKEIEEISNDVRIMRAAMLAEIDHELTFAFGQEERDKIALKLYGKTYGKIPNVYKDIGIMLATIRRRYPSALISLDSLEKDYSDASLPKAIKRYHGGWSRVTRCFYPNARDLMPFLIMMEIHFHYNLETILGSKITDFFIADNEFGRKEFASSLKSEHEKNSESDDDEVLFVGMPRKRRAKSARQLQIRPATEDLDNPANIYKFLLEWTEEIRSRTAPNFVERLFIFVSARLKDDALPRGFRGHDGLCCTDSAFDLAYAGFFKDNKLSHQNFRKFRATGLDIADILFSGDIRAKQAAGNHSDPDVTYKRYSTGGQMERGDEVLGETRLLHHRWRTSERVIDPRRKPEGADLGSATPGWDCLDPFDPPVGTKDKLCTEYGQCPDCPHGSTRLDDPYACAQAWNLLAAIDKSASELPPQAWLDRWAPVKSALLTYWLPQFSEVVRSEAAQYRLHPLPPLE
jgi:hypothetical protein